MRRQLESGSEPRPRVGHRLGSQAVALGLETLDLARIHKEAFAAATGRGLLTMSLQRAIKRARRFFDETLCPIEKTHRAAVKTDIRVVRLTRTLRRRTLESAASTRCLKRSILMRRGAERALKTDGKRLAGLRAERCRLQTRLRGLTRKCLSMLEDNRQRMSLQLHDEIAQALIAIDLQLLSLKKAAVAGAESLKKELADTQRLMKQSKKRIEQFAHEFSIQHEA